AGGDGRAERRGRGDRAGGRTGAGLPRLQVLRVSADVRGPDGLPAVNGRCGCQAACGSLITMHVIDTLVLVFYFAAMLGIGFLFVRKSGRTDEYMAAGRSLPGWAVGLSLFGTYVSSISFIALPGK